MKDLKAWLDEYQISHQHPTNKFIHKICVPLILFSVLGLLYNLPTFYSVNLAYLIWGLCLVFYASLGIKSFLLMVGVGGTMLGILFYLNSLIHLVPWMLGIFILSWIGQFWGHKIEGKRPSFLKDLFFLLIGPLWVFGADSN